MANTMKMRARLQGDVTEVKVLIGHPMETGRRRNALDEVVPAHFIQLLTAAVNGKPVLEAQWGTGIAKNPYLTFHVRGAKVGDLITVRWQDNLGASGSGEIAVIADGSG